jgi:hypothetical protein
MDQVFEALGRKQFQLESLDKEYTRLMELLAGVVSGSIEPSRVTVNLTDRRWALADKKECVAATVETTKETPVSDRSPLDGQV